MVKKRNMENKIEPEIVIAKLRADLAFANYVMASLREDKKVLYNEINSLKNQPLTYVIVPNSTDLLQQESSDAHNTYYELLRKKNNLLLQSDI